MTSTAPQSFYLRHEFLIRRLHSLTGLMPVGLYMVVHLLTNASMLAGAPSFQKNVDSIHSLGPALPLVEWTFIFLPIIFHAVVGVMIVRSGKSNSSRYSFSGNVRYTLQRATAWIALIFIFWHVFHMHGWIHNDIWMDKLAKPLYGGQFDPHHATSSVGIALEPLIARIAYAVGVAACVFHFANGLWTMGITWGIWETAAAQRRANWLCGGIGVLLFTVGMGALFGAVRAGEKDNLMKAEAYEQAKDDAERRFEEDYKSRLEQEKATEAAPAEKAAGLPGKEAAEAAIPPVAQSDVRP